MSVQMVHATMFGKSDAVELSDIRCLCKVADMFAQRNDRDLAVALLTAIYAILDCNLAASAELA